MTEAHSFRVLPCPAHPAGAGMWFWHCPRCGITSECYPSRRLAQIAADHYHAGGTIVRGFAHLGGTRKP